MTYRTDSSNRRVKTLDRYLVILVLFTFFMLLGFREKPAEIPEAEREKPAEVPEAEAKAEAVEEEVPPEAVKLDEDVARLADIAGELENQLNQITESVGQLMEDLAAEKSKDSPDAKRLAELAEALGKERGELEQFRNKNRDVLNELDSLLVCVDMAGEAGGNRLHRPQRILARRKQAIRKQDMLRMWYHTPELGDINNDGLLDVAVIFRMGVGLTAWLNDGKGGWVEASDGLPEQVVGYRLKMVDVNKDGNIDLVAAFHRVREGVCGTHVYLGDGTGKWRESSTGIRERDVQDVVVADFNGDGNLDIADLGYHDIETVVFYLGDGKGGWKPWKTTGLPARKTKSDFHIYGTDLRAADLNNDKHMDIVLNHCGEATFGHEMDPVWLGDGKGNFRNASIGLAHDQDCLNWGVDIGDVNNDGLVDLLIIRRRYGRDVASRVEIYLNNGFGVWHPADVAIKALNARFADFNGDGNLDIAVVTLREGGIQVWKGDGSGAWKLQPGAGVGKANSGKMMATTGDVDRDGHDDIVAVYGNNKEDSGTGEVIKTWSVRTVGLRFRERIDALEKEFEREKIESPGGGEAPESKPEIKPATPPAEGPAGQDAARPEPEGADKYESIYRMLKSRFFSDRDAAVRRLLGQGRAAGPFLKKCLCDKDVHVRLMAIDLMAMVGDDSQFEDLVKIAAGEESQIRRHALRAVDIFDPFGKRLEAMSTEDAKKVSTALETYDPVLKWKFSLAGVSQPGAYFGEGTRLPGDGDPLNDPRLEELMNQIHFSLESGNVETALRACQEFIDVNMSSFIECENRVTVRMAAHPVIETTIRNNLKQYRELFDRTADDEFELVEKEHVRDVLFNFLCRWMFTSAAPRALGLLIEGEYECGLYRQVVWDWEGFDRLQSVDLITYARVAASYCRIARPDKARAMLIGAQRMFPDGVILVRGAKKKSLNAFILDEASHAPRVPAGYGGVNRGTEVGNPFAAQADLGSIRFDLPRWGRHLGGEYGSVYLTRKLSRKDGKMKLFFPWDIPEDRKARAAFFEKKGLTKLPPSPLSRPFGISVGGKPPAGHYPYHIVVSGDRAILNNGLSVWCLSIKDGRLLWYYDNPIDIVAIVRTLGEVPLDRDEKYPYSLVVEEERAVYVVMENPLVSEAVLRRAKAGNPAPGEGDNTGGLETGFSGEPVGRGAGLIRQPRQFVPAPGVPVRGVSHKPLQPGSTILCLDLDTGAVRWNAASDKYLKNVFIKSPLRYSRGVLYVTSSNIVHRGRINEKMWFEVLAIDAASGALMWHTPVAYWGKAFFTLRMRHVGRQIIPSPAQVLGNSIFVLTNAGSLASVRASDGRVNWAARYPCAQSAAFWKLSKGRKQAGQVVELQPPAVWGSNVYIMPSDAEFLFAYDAISGRLLWRVKTGRVITQQNTGVRRARLDFEQFMLADDGTLYIWGIGGMSAYDNRGMQLWYNREIVASGMPALGRDCIAVPTPGAIVLVDLKTGDLKTRHEIDADRILKQRAAAAAEMALGGNTESETNAGWMELLAISRDDFGVVKALPKNATSEDKKKSLEELVERLRVRLGIYTLSGRTGKDLATGGNLLLVRGRLFWISRTGLVLRFSADK